MSGKVLELDTKFQPEKTAPPMSGKVLELDTKFQPKKCGGRCKGLDWISKLPDDIIVYMLSFLSLKEAIATCLVSRRWSHLWRYTPNLIFKNNRTQDAMINIPVAMPVLKHGGPQDRELTRTLKNIEWVNLVLTSHKAHSLKQFAISFYIHEQYHYQVLTRWLCFAFLRQVESLRLNLRYATSILDYNILSTIPIDDYKYLKELKLKQLSVSGEAIEVFLRNCPLLASLTIKGVVLTSDLMVDGTSLHNLEIISYRSRGITTKVYAPNLSRLDCCYELKFFFLENVPNLVEASFDLTIPDDTLDHVAKAASKLETLTLHIYEPTGFPVPEMPRLRKLVVDISFMKKEFPLPVTCLIQASPCLEEFILEISKVREYQHNSFSSIFEVPKDGNKAEHQHLKVFEFSGFCGSAADHIELLRYIGDSCSVVLQKITIITIPPVFVLPYEDDDDFMDEADCKESPYLVWTGSFDRDVIKAKVDEAELEINKWTERVVAAALPKLPNHIKLSILSS